MCLLHIKEVLFQLPECRNIDTLFNFEPPATGDETGAAVLRFVRKLSGFNRPSQRKQAAFDRAIEEVATAAVTLIGALVTKARHAVRG